MTSSIYLSIYLPLTGMQVRASMGRLKGNDRDFYDFKLRCGIRWNIQWMGLRFESMATSQTDASVCPGGTPVTGIQVNSVSPFHPSSRASWAYVNSLSLFCPSGRFDAPAALQRLFALVCASE